MKFSIYLLIIFTSYNLCRAQLTSDPVPKIGWDALKKSITYPENYQRALADGYADVTVRIDSIGKITSVEVFANLPLFKDSVESALRKVEWFPAKSMGVNVDGIVNLSIHFVSPKLGKHLMIIEGYK